MDKGYIVLEEKLVEAFFDFYEDKKSVDKDLKLKLFRFLKPFNITREQLEKYYSKISKLPDAMKIQAMLNNEYWFVAKKEDFQDFSMENPFSAEIMEKLVEKSCYKILLVQQYNANSTIKEVNINELTAQFPYVEKIKKSESKKIAQAHLINLMKHAYKIEIIDRYCHKVLTQIQNLLKQANCLDTCDITIYTESTGNMSFALIDKKIKIKPYKDKLHDRYLIIDDKVEIILSSGFQYLFDDKKELTYIITEK